MYLYSPFMLSELCPLENFQTKIYGSGIKSIDMTIQTKDFFCVYRACFINQATDIILEDSCNRVARLSWIDCFWLWTAHTQVIQLSPMSFERND